MSATLHLLCAGAAQGLVRALEPRWAGAALQARFGAVGAMKEALLAGEPCDVMIVTAAMVEGLIAEGHLQRNHAAALGRVRTGLAVREGAVAPAIGSADELKAALLGADALHVPDLQRSTAGAHVAAVLRRLGLFDAMAPRLREHPNGATAMRELAASPAAHPIGITQVSEILDTAGVRLVAALPPAFELATVYTAATASRSTSTLAASFIALLAGHEAAAQRRACGFED